LAKNDLSDEEVDRLLKTMDDDDYEEPPSESETTTTKEPKHSLRRTSAKRDEFPIPGKHINLSTNPAAKQRLLELSEYIQESGNYLTTRDEFCALNIQLNAECLIAPAFRPRPKLQASKHDEMRTTLQRDLIVIDCNWLHARNEHILEPEKKYRRLLVGSKDFSFDEAWDFANLEWTNDHRATNVLNLSTAQQCQMMSLRGTAVADRAARALGGQLKSGKKVKGAIVAIKQKINDWGCNDIRARKLFDDYVQLWLARELLGSAGSLNQISMLHGLMRGQRPLNGKTISDKLKRLDREITRV